MKKQEGFTLIETLIYIAFFAVLVGSLLGITFQTIDNSARLSKKITIQQEANFILRKIEWAINSGETVVADTATLTVNLYNGGGQVVFSSEPDYVRVFRNGDPNPLPLNSENAKVSNVSFIKSNQEIKVSLNVEGENFQLTKFLRK